MAFWGEEFSFDEKSCADYELMIYDIGNTSQSDTAFASIVKIQEEFVGSKWRPLFYGVQHEKKQEIEIVFGANQERIDEGRYFSRSEIAEIASWLTGHDEYKWLQIHQDDMQGFRYRCMVSSLQQISYGRYPWAMKIKFVCDSPYAYMLPEEHSWEIAGSTTIEFENKASHNGLYSPIVEILPSSGGSFSIINESNGKSGISFSNIPTSAGTVSIDNETGVITNNGGVNLYPYFNFQFLHLKRGMNTLNITGNGTVTIRCEFPINVGG